jgi:peptide/nickel transport system substrate-binding protein
MPPRTTRRFLPGLRKRDAVLLTRADGRYPHAYVPELADRFAAGRIDRRGFLRTACLLGVSAGAAYAFAGRIDGGPMAPPAAAQDFPRQGGELRFAMEVMEITDPAAFAWPQQANITRWMVEYLTRTGPDNVTLPYLAEGWEASDDLRTWTFTLRQGVRWSNGDRFNADDVVANFQRWFDPNRVSANRSLFDGLGEPADAAAAGAGPQARVGLRDGAVEKLGAHSFRLHLSRPDLSVPESLYNYPAAILHRDFDAMGGDFQANPIGTGPYTLAAFAPGEEARLVRRPDDYWGAPPHLDAIRYIDRGRDRREMLGALLADEVDGVYEVDVGDLSALEGVTGIDLHSVSTAQTGVCRMRVDTPPFDDIRVRRAVQLAADNRDLLINGYNRRGMVAENHHVGPMHPEYATLPAVPRDPGLARQLLADAGYPAGLQLTLTVGNVQGPWEQRVAQVLQQQLRQAGIELKLDIVAPQAYARRWTEVPFGMTSWTHRPLGVMALNLGYRSGQAWNETRYANPEFDDKLATANGLLDPNARREVMEEVQRILQRDAVMVQPFWRNQYVATRARVRGYQTHPTQYHQFQDVWLADV